MTGLARFAVIDEDDCLDLLRTHRVGRVGWEAADGPTILPVNYRFEGHAVVFRTSRSSTLAQIPAGHPVAFEVDEYDDETETGWSVLVRGRIAEPVGPDDEGWLWRNHPPVPWAGSDRAEFVSIEVGAVSGRIVSAE